MLRFLAAAVLAGTCLAQTPDDLEAVIETSAGAIRIEFSADKAPKHVEQFLKLARQGYYNGSAFFRAVMNGIIQGGDPLLKDPKTPRNLWGTGGLSMIASEFSDLKHERGVVSSVSIPNKANSEGAQFFICVTPQPGLDGKYSAFARVTEGMDVVEKISQQPLDANSILQTPVRIEKVTIEPKKREPYLSATVEELKKTVVIETTLGKLRVAMRPEWAPETVRNFLKVASTSWYDHTAFHRIAKGFVAQGGMAYTREPQGPHNTDRWIRPIKGEFPPDVKHLRGTLSMARTDDPNSATTSFFLVLAPSPHLDGQYAAFGEVVEGLDVLDAFEKEEVDGDTPKRRIELVQAKVEYGPFPPRNTCRGFERDATRG
jgi:cyclophilin family peptidyl-prolyl cis-trans isomerase